MQISSPHHEKHKIGENFNNRKNDTPRGTLGPAEVEKFFCRNFANKLYIRSSYGVLITKNTKLEKILTIEKMTLQRGTLGPAEVEKILTIEKMTPLGPQKC